MSTRVELPVCRGFWSEWIVLQFILYLYYTAKYHSVKVHIVNSQSFSFAVSYIFIVLANALAVFMKNKKKKPRSTHGFFSKDFD
jgi:hypothetical protein